jgi:hypothetical protein
VEAVHNAALPEVLVAETELLWVHGLVVSVRRDWKPTIQFHRRRESAGEEQFWHPESDEQRRDHLQGERREPDAVPV